MYGNYMIIYFSGCLVALLLTILLPTAHSISKVHVFLSRVAVVLLSWLAPILALVFYIIYKIQYNK